MKENLIHNLKTAGKYVAAGVGTVVGTTILGLGLSYSMITIASSVPLRPHPPIFYDVNNDGIKDKIVERKVPAHDLVGVVFGLSDYEEEVLYGMNINGKIIYLQKEQFNNSKN